MPKIIKKKPAKKKSFRQEDEVKSAARQALEKAKERQQQLVIGAGAVLAIIVIYIAVSVYSSSASQKASTIENEAHQYYYGEIADDSLTESSRWKAALDLYLKSLDAKATPSALFYAGNCSYNMGDYDAAIEHYTRFTREFSSDTSILPLVYQRLASAYFKSDKNDLALSTTAKLGEVAGGTFKDSALILEARYFERMGEKEKAETRFKELVDRYAGSPWSVEASSKIAVEEEQKEAPADSPAQDGPGESAPPADNSDAPGEAADEPQAK
jgi:tetratricopeptide (TPR) repeat protein